MPEGGINGVWKKTLKRGPVKTCFRAIKALKREPP